MLCCANCFVSPTLKHHIDSEGSIDDCEFCGSKDVKCLEVSDLYGFFLPIFGLYRECEYGRDYFKGEEPRGEFLPDLIENDWYPIFSDDFDIDKIDDFWDVLVETTSYNIDDPPLDLSTLFVSIDLGFDISWESFSYYLKKERRFTIENEELKHFVNFLPELLSSIEIKVDVGERYYRARLGTGDEIKPFAKEKMGAPPPEKSMAGGRANPPGIPFFYLANDANTAIAEVRPWKGARVSVASFTPLKDLSLVDLTEEFHIDDQFAYGEELRNIIEDHNLLSRLGKELSKPVNPNKTSVEYVPTQYLTEIMRNLEYDGMIYPSALGKGNNIVLFDENVANCDNVKLCHVDSVDYTYS